MMKRHVSKQSVHVVKAPPRPFLVRAGVALLLAALCALFLFAVAVVDRNSRKVGWDQPRTEFSVSVEGDELRLAAFGTARTVPLSQVRAVTDTAQAVAGRAYAVIQSLKLPTARLTQAACIQVGQKEGWRVWRAVLCVWDAGQTRLQALVSGR